MGDLDGTLATLDPEPVYELLPMGVTLAGQDFVRAYYQRFFSECMPRFVGYELRNEWIMDDGLGQEYRIDVSTPDGPRRYDILGILTFGDHGLLSGERLYAGDDLLHFLFGHSCRPSTDHGGRARPRPEYPRHSRSGRDRIHR